MRHPKSITQNPTHVNIDLSSQATTVLLFPWKLFGVVFLGTIILFVIDIVILVKTPAKNIVDAFMCALVTLGIEFGCFQMYQLCKRLHFHRVGLFECLVLIVHYVALVLFFAGVLDVKWVLIVVGIVLYLLGACLAWFCHGLSGFCS